MYPTRRTTLASAALALSMSGIPATVVAMEMDSMGMGMGSAGASTPGTTTATSAPAHGVASGADAAPLLEQLDELRAQVARLEAALERGHGAAADPMSDPGDRPAMAGSMERMGMKRDSSMAKGMGGMGMRTAGREMGKRMRRMGMMGDMDMMSGMGGMGMSPGAVSALPGFPGASHLYHIGATGFFLDHDEHVSLTGPQERRLSEIREAAWLAESTMRRDLEQAEQDLWQLTAADSPDASAVEAKVREIERLRGDQRLAFIRAVGEAAQVLTPEQRRALLGEASDALPSTSHGQSGPSDPAARP